MDKLTRTPRTHRNRTPGRPVRRKAPELAKSKVEAFSRLAPGNYHGIARRSGLSLQHVSRVLRGIRGATLTTAARIARGAGVSMDELVAYRAANGADLDYPYEGAA